MKPKEKFALLPTKLPTKLCPLCGTLNHAVNAECWTCRWHGGFSVDPHLLLRAWQRLEAQYEEVRLEHLTSRQGRVLGDFGTPLPATRPQQAALWLRACWQKFQTARDLRSAQRLARLRPTIPSRPNVPSRPDSLGV